MNDNNYLFEWYYEDYEFGVKYNIIELLDLEIINNYF